MQYLLTEEEYRTLIQRSLHTVEQIQQLCTMVAEYAPGRYRWAPTSTQPARCIHSSTDPAAYCDFCPVVDLCPSTRKQFSK